MYENLNTVYIYKNIYKQWNIYKYINFHFVKNNSLMYEKNDLDITIIKW